jgi:hypothetical protein
MPAGTGFAKTSSIEIMVEELVPELHVMRCQDTDMVRVAIQISDAELSKRLRTALESNFCLVPLDQCQDADCVLVADAAALESIPKPLRTPERIILLASKDSNDLAAAWNAGVRSVVWAGSPAGLIVLAIMAAALRPANAMAASKFQGGHHAKTIPAKSGDLGSSRDDRSDPGDPPMVHRPA